MAIRCANGLNGGARKLVVKGSVEEQIVADCLELGLGLRSTAAMVNNFRCAEGLQLMHVGVSAIYTAYKRMDAITCKIGKRKQGSKDS